MDFVSNIGAAAFKCWIAVRRFMAAAEADVRRKAPRKTTLINERMVNYTGR